MPYNEDFDALKKDYCARAARRAEIEAQWRLNVRFAAGDQFCIKTISGIETVEPTYEYEERQVFNHISSIVETRLAKLARVRPTMSVRPASGDGDDLMTARASTKILAAAANTLDMPKLLSRGTLWSEMCGSVFYKTVWRGLGDEGDVAVEVVSPFEIYPDDLSAIDVDALRSIIHARAVDVDVIRDTYGIEVAPEPLYGSCDGQKIEHAALVIERYTLPNADLPEGEFCVGANGKMLYAGALPFRVGAGFTLGLPFIKQDSVSRPDCFFGISPIERVIPIQRAYNAVKNRKHELIGRIAAGVMAVEDGSVDTEALEAEGLPPGKVVVYRQGSTPPRLLEAGHVPSDFSAEEDRLLNEFISVSGVSEIMRSSSIPSSLTSGVALQLLIEQDDTRLSLTAENVRQAARQTAAHILRLYKQFASTPRLARVTGKEGDIELIRFSESDIGGDDVVCDTENELSTSPATKQNMLFELLKAGLLYDADGRLDESTRYKILDVMGYGGWEQIRDEKTLHRNRAERENEGEPDIKEYDDHDAHIAVHTQYLLSREFSSLPDHAAREKKLVAHIREHKRFRAVERGETV